MNPEDFWSDQYRDFELENEELNVTPDEERKLKFPDDHGKVDFSKSSYYNDGTRPNPEATGTGTSAGSKPGMMYTNPWSGYKYNPNDLNDPNHPDNPKYGINAKPDQSNPSSNSYFDDLYNSAGEVNAGEEYRKRVANKGYDFDPKWTEETIRERGGQDLLDQYNKRGYIGTIEYGVENERLGVKDQSKEFAAENRAQNQGKWETFNNAVDRFVWGTLSKTVSGIAASLDFEDYWNSDDEMGNWLSNAADDFTKAVEEDNEIYTSKEGAWTSWNWWMKNGADLTSSIAAFAAQGIATGAALGRGINSLKGLTKWGKTVKDLKQLENVDDVYAMSKDALTKTEQIAIAMSKIADKGVDYMNTGVNALMLNQAEAVTSATSIYQEAYDEAIRRGHNPEYARQVAAYSASVVVSTNRVNLVNNLFITNKLMKAAGVKSASPALKTNAQLFGNEPVKGFFGKTKNFLAQGKDLAIEGAFEGAEEFINYGAELAAKQAYTGILDNKDKTYKDELKNLTPANRSNYLAPLGSIATLGAKDLIRGVYDGITEGKNLITGRMGGIGNGGKNAWNDADWGQAFESFALGVLGGAGTQVAVDNFGRLKVRQVQETFAKDSETLDVNGNPLYKAGQNKFETIKIKAKADEEYSAETVLDRDIYIEEEAKAKKAVRNEKGAYEVSFDHLEGVEKEEKEDGTFDYKRDGNGNIIGVAYDKDGNIEKNEDGSVKGSIGNKKITTHLKRGTFINKDLAEKLKANGILKNKKDEDVIARDANGLAIETYESIERRKLDANAKADYATAEEFKKDSKGNAIAIFEKSRISTKELERRIEAKTKDRMIGMNNANQIASRANQSAKFTNSVTAAQNGLRKLSSTVMSPIEYQATLERTAEHLAIFEFAQGKQTFTAEEFAEKVEEIKHELRPSNIIDYASQKVKDLDKLDFDKQILMSMEEGTIEQFEYLLKDIARMKPEQAEAYGYNPLTYKEDVKKLQDKVKVMKDRHTELVRRHGYQKGRALFLIVGELEDRQREALDLGTSIEEEIKAQKESATSSVFNGNGLHETKLKEVIDRISSLQAEMQEKITDAENNISNDLDEEGKKKAIEALKSEMYGQKYKDDLAKLEKEKATLSKEIIANNTKIETAEAGIVEETENIRQTNQRLTKAQDPSTVMSEQNFLSQAEARLSQFKLDKKKLEDTNSQIEEKSKNLVKNYEQELKTTFEKKSKVIEKDSITKREKIKEIEDRLYNKDYRNKEQKLEEERLKAQAEYQKLEVERAEAEKDGNETLVKIKKAQINKVAKEFNELDNKFQEEKISLNNQFNEEVIKLDRESDKRKDKLRTKYKGMMVEAIKASKDPKFPSEQYDIAVEDPLFIDLLISKSEGVAVLKARKKIVLSRAKELNERFDALVNDKGYNEFVVKDRIEKDSLLKKLSIIRSTIENIDNSQKLLKDHVEKNPDALHNGSVVYKGVRFKEVKETLEDEEGNKFEIISYEKVVHDFYCEVGRDVSEPEVRILRPMNEEPKVIHDTDDLEKYRNVVMPGKEEEFLEIVKDINENNSAIRKLWKKWREFNTEITENSVKIAELQKKLEGETDVLVIENTKNEIDGLFKINKEKTDERNKLTGEINDINAKNSVAYKSKKDMLYYNIESKDTTKGTEYEGYNIVSPYYSKTVEMTNARGLKFSVEEIARSPKLVDTDVEGKKNIEWTSADKSEIKNDYELADDQSAMVMAIYFGSKQEPVAQLVTIETLSQNTQNVKLEDKLLKREWATENTRKSVSEIVKTISSINSRRDEEGKLTKEDEDALMVNYIKLEDLNLASPAEMFREETTEEELVDLLVTEIGKKFDDSERYAIRYANPDVIKDDDALKAIFPNGDEYIDAEQSLTDYAAFQKIQYLFANKQAKSSYIMKARAAVLNAIREYKFDPKDSANNLAIQNGLVNALMGKEFFSKALNSEEGVKLNLKENFDKLKLRIRVQEVSNFDSALFEKPKSAVVIKISPSNEVQESVTSSIRNNMTFDKNLNLIDEYYKLVSNLTVMTPSESIKKYAEIRLKDLLLDRKQRALRNLDLQEDIKDKAIQEYNAELEKLKDLDLLNRNMLNNQELLIDAVNRYDVDLLKEFGFTEDEINIIKNLSKTGEAQAIMGLFDKNIMMLMLDKEKKLYEQRKKKVKELENRIKTSKEKIDTNTNKLIELRKNTTAVVDEETYAVYRTMVSAFEEEIMENEQLVSVISDEVSSLNVEIDAINDKIEQLQQYSKIDESAFSSQVQNRFEELRKDRDAYQTLTELYDNIENQARFNGITAAVGRRYSLMIAGNSDDVVARKEATRSATLKHSMISKLDELEEMINEQLKLALNSDNTEGIEFYRRLKSNVETLKNPENVSKEYLELSDKLPSLELLLSMYMSKIDNQDILNKLEEIIEDRYEMLVISKSKDVDGFVNINITDIFDSVLDDFETNEAIFTQSKTRVEYLKKIARFSVEGHTNVLEMAALDTEIDRLESQYSDLEQVLSEKALAEAKRRLDELRTQRNSFNVYVKDGKIQNATEFTVDILETKDISSEKLKDIDGKRKDIINGILGILEENDYLKFTNTVYKGKMKLAKLEDKASVAHNRAMTLAALARSVNTTIENLPMYNESELEDIYNKNNINDIFKELAIETQAYEKSIQDFHLERAKLISITNSLGGFIKRKDKAGKIINTNYGKDMQAFQLSSIIDPANYAALNENASEILTNAEKMLKEVKAIEQAINTFANKLENTAKSKSRNAEDYAMLHKNFALSALEEFLTSDPNFVNKISKLNSYAQVLRTLLYNSNKEEVTVDKLKELMKFANVEESELSTYYGVKDEVPYFHVADFFNRLMTSYEKQMFDLIIAKDKEVKTNFEESLKKLENEGYLKQSAYSKNAQDQIKIVLQLNYRSSLVSRLKDSLDATKTALGELKRQTTLNESNTMSEDEFNSGAEMTRKQNLYATIMLYPELEKEVEMQSKRNIKFDLLNSRMETLAVKKEELDAKSIALIDLVGGESANRFDKGYLEKLYESTYTDIKSKLKSLFSNEAVFETLKAAINASNFTIIKKIVNGTESRYNMAEALLSQIGNPTIRGFFAETFNSEELKTHKPEFDRHVSKIDTLLEIEKSRSEWAPILSDMDYLREDIGMYKKLKATRTKNLFDVEFDTAFKNSKTRADIKKLSYGEHAYTKYILFKKRNALNKTINTMGENAKLATDAVLKITSEVAQLNISLENYKVSGNKISEHRKSIKKASENKTPIIPQEIEVYINDLLNQKKIDELKAKYSGKTLTGKDVDDFLKEYNAAVQSHYDDRSELGKKISGLNKEIQKNSLDSIKKANPENLLKFIDEINSAILKLDSPDVSMLSKLERAAQVDITEYSRQVKLIQDLKLSDTNVVYYERDPENYQEEKFRLYHVTSSKEDLFTSTNYDVLKDNERAIKWQKGLHSVINNYGFNKSTLNVRYVHFNQEGWIVDLVANAQEKGKTLRQIDDEFAEKAKAENKLVKRNVYGVITSKEKDVIKYGFYYENTGGIIFFSEEEYKSLDEATKAGLQLMFENISGEGSVQRKGYNSFEKIFLIQHNRVDDTGVFENMPIYNVAGEYKSVYSVRNAITDHMNLFEDETLNDASKLGLYSVNNYKAYSFGNTSDTTYPELIYAIAESETMKNRELGISQSTLEKVMKIPFIANMILSNKSKPENAAKLEKYIYKAVEIYNNFLSKVSDEIMSFRDSITSTNDVKYSYVPRTTIGSFKRDKGLNSLKSVFGKVIDDVQIDIIGLKDGDKENYKRFAGFPRITYKGSSIEGYTNTLTDADILTTVKLLQLIKTNKGKKVSDGTKDRQEYIFNTETGEEYSIHVAGKAMNGRAGLLHRIVAMKYPERGKKGDSKYQFYFDNGVIKFMAEYKNNTTGEIKQVERILSSKDMKMLSEMKSDSELTALYKTLDNTSNLKFFIHSMRKKRQNILSDSDKSGVYEHPTLDENGNVVLKIYNSYKEFLLETDRIKIKAHPHGDEALKDLPTNNAYLVINPALLNEPFSEEDSIALKERQRKALAIKRINNAVKNYKSNPTGDIKNIKTAILLRDAAEKIDNLVKAIEGDNKYLFDTEIEKIGELTIQDFIKAAQLEIEGVKERFKKEEREKEELEKKAKKDTTKTDSKEADKYKDINKAPVAKADTSNLKTEGIVTVGNKKKLIDISKKPIAIAPAKRLARSFTTGSHMIENGSSFMSANNLLNIELTDGKLSKVNGLFSKFGLVTVKDNKLVFAKEEVLNEKLKSLNTTADIFQIIKTYYANFKNQYEANEAKNYDAKGNPNPNFLAIFNNVVTVFFSDDTLKSNAEINKKSKEAIYTVLNKYKVLKDDVLTDEVLELIDRAKDDGFLNDDDMVSLEQVLKVNLLRSKDVNHLFNKDSLLIDLLSRYNYIPTPNVLEKEWLNEMYDHLEDKNTEEQDFEGKTIIKNQRRDKINNILRTQNNFVNIFAIDYDSMTEGQVISLIEKRADASNENNEVSPSGIFSKEAKFTPKQLTTEFEKVIPKSNDALLLLKTLSELPQLNNVSVEVNWGDGINTERSTGKITMGAKDRNNESFYLMTLNHEIIHSALGRTELVPEMKPEVDKLRTELFNVSKQFYTDIFTKNGNLKSFFDVKKEIEAKIGREVANIDIHFMIRALQPRIENKQDSESYNKASANFKNSFSEADYTAFMKETKRLLDKTNGTNEEILAYIFNTPNFVRLLNETKYPGSNESLLSRILKAIRQFVNSIVEEVKVNSYLEKVLSVTEVLKSAEERAIIEKESNTVIESQPIENQNEAEIEDDDVEEIPTTEDLKETEVIINENKEIIKENDAPITTEIQEGNDLKLANENHANIKPHNFNNPEVDLDDLFSSEDLDYSDSLTDDVTYSKIISNKAILMENTNYEVNQAEVDEFVEGMVTKFMTIIGNQKTKLGKADNGEDITISNVEVLKNPYKLFEGEKSLKLYDIMFKGNITDYKNNRHPDAANNNITLLSNIVLNDLNNAYADDSDSANAKFREISKEFKSIVISRFKLALKAYKIQLNDEFDENEQMKDNMDYKDSMTINSWDMAKLSTKLLLGSLPLLEVATINGKRIITASRNLSGFATSVNANRLYNMIQNITANSPVNEGLTVIDILRSAVNENYRKAMAGEKYNKQILSLSSLLLSVKDIKERNFFHIPTIKETGEMYDNTLQNLTFKNEFMQTFSKSHPLFTSNHVLDKNIEMFDSNINFSYKTIEKTWRNNSFITVDQDGKMKEEVKKAIREMANFDLAIKSSGSAIEREQLENKANEIAMDFYATLGITFTLEAPEFAKEYSKFKKSTSISKGIEFASDAKNFAASLKEFIEKGEDPSATLADKKNLLVSNYFEYLYNNRDSKTRSSKIPQVFKNINNLAKVEIQNANIDETKQHTTPDGETMFGVNLHSNLSVTAASMNANRGNDILFYQRNRHLKSAFSRNSYFTKQMLKHRESAEINIGYSMGLTTSVGDGQVIKDLKIQDKFVADMHNMFYENKYPYLRAADRTSESTFDLTIEGVRIPILGPSTEKFDFKNSLSIDTNYGTSSVERKPYDYFFEHLEDEAVACYLEEDIAKRLVYYETKSKKFRFFQSIISQEIDSSPEEKALVDDLAKAKGNRALTKAAIVKHKQTVTKKLKEYFKNEAQAYIEWAVENDIIVKSYGKDGESTYKIHKMFGGNGVNFETIKKIMENFTMINSASYIEQTKIFTGDPGFFKNADDIFKRFKMFNATKKASLLNTTELQLLNDNNFVKIGNVKLNYNNEEHVDIIKALYFNNFDVRETLNKNNLLAEQIQILNSLPITNDIVFGQGFRPDSAWSKEFGTIVVADHIFRDSQSLGDANHPTDKRILDRKTIDQITVVKDSDGNFRIADKDKNPYPLENLGEMVISFLEGFLEDGITDENVLANKIRSYADPSTKVNEADAESYCTLPMYKAILIASGEQWTSALEYVYAKAMLGEELTPEEYAELVRKDGDFYGAFTKLKTHGSGFLNSVTMVENGVKTKHTFGEEYDSVVPVFGYKHSLLPLIPSVIKNRKPLKDLNDFMIKNGVHLAQTQSAVKYGAVGTFPVLNEKTGIVEYKTLPFYNAEKNGLGFDNTYTIQYTDFRYFGVQVDMRASFKGKVTAGSQVRKLLLNNMFEYGVPIDFTKKFKEEGFDFEEIKELWNESSEDFKLENSEFYNQSQEYMSVQEALYNHYYKEMLKDFSITEIDGKVEVTNMKAFVDMVISSMIERGRRMEDIRSAEKFLKSQRLEFISGSKSVQSILYSIVNNRVVREKRKGEGAPQAAATGWAPSKKELDEQLKSYRYNHNKSNILPATCKIALPEDMNSYISRKYKNVSNKLEAFNNDIKALLSKLKVIEETANPGKIALTGEEETLKAFITIVGFRIPNQGLSSTDILRVQEFLPTTMGTTIVVPPNMTAKAGSDFDIDKLTLYTPHYSINGDKIEMVKYMTEENSTEEDRYNAFVDSQKLEKIDENDDDLEAYMQLKEEAKALGESKASIKSSIKLTEKERYDEFKKAMSEAKGIFKKEAKAKLMEEAYDYSYSAFFNLGKNLGDEFRGIQARQFTLLKSEKSPGEKITAMEKLLVNIEIANTLIEKYKDNPVMKIELEDVLQSYDYIQQLAIPAEVSKIINQKIADSRKEAVENFKAETALATATEQLEMKNIEEQLSRKRSLIKSIIRAYKIKSLGLMSQSDFAAQPISYQNNVKGLQNRMIDIHSNIMMHNTKLRQLLSPISDSLFKDEYFGTVWDTRFLMSGEKEMTDYYNYLQSIQGDSNYDALKKAKYDEQRAIYVERYVKETETNASITSVYSHRVNLQKFLAFLSGKAGVGIAALQNTFNTLSQMVDLYLNTDNYDSAFVFDYNKTVINGKEYPSMGGKTSKDGELISETISAFINAYVDVAKDPFVFDINAGLFTAGTMFNMLRFGASSTVVNRFLNQPMIRRYVRVMENGESIMFKQDNQGKSKKGYQAMSNLIDEAGAIFIDNSSMKEWLRKFYANSFSLASDGRKLKSTTGKNVMGLAGQTEYIVDKEGQPSREDALKTAITNAKTAYNVEFNNKVLDAEMLEEMMLEYATFKRTAKKPAELEKLFKKQLILADLFTVYRWQAGKMRTEVASNMNYDTAGAKADIANNENSVGKVMTEKDEYAVVNNVYGNAHKLGTETVIAMPKRAVRTMHRVVTMATIMYNSKDYPTVVEAFKDLKTRIQEDNRSKYMNSESFAKMSDNLLQDFKASLILSKGVFDFDGKVLNFSPEIVYQELFSDKNNQEKDTTRPSKYKSISGVRVSLVRYLNELKYITQVWKTENGVVSAETIEKLNKFYQLTGKEELTVAKVMSYYNANIKNFKCVNTFNLFEKLTFNVANDSLSWNELVEQKSIKLGDTYNVNNIDIRYMTINDDERQRLTEQLDIIKIQNSELYYDLLRFAVNQSGTRVNKRMSFVGIFSSSDLDKLFDDVISQIGVNELNAKLPGLIKQFGDKIIKHDLSLTVAQRPFYQASYDNDFEGNEVGDTVSYQNTKTKLLYNMKKIGLTGGRNRKVGLSRTLRPENPNEPAPPAESDVILIGHRDVFYGVTIDLEKGDIMTVAGNPAGEKAPTQENIEDWFDESVCL